RELQDGIATSRSAQLLLPGRSAVEPALRARALSRRRRDHRQVDATTIGGNGPAVEYAVKMRQFPQEPLATHALSTGRLCAEHIDALAAQVADFHRKTSVASSDHSFGAEDAI